MTMLNMHAWNVHGHARNHSTYLGHQVRVLAQGVEALHVQHDSHTRHLPISSSVQHAVRLGWHGSATQPESRVMSTGQARERVVLAWRGSEANVHGRIHVISGAQKSFEPAPSAEALYSFSRLC